MIRLSIKTLAKYMTATPAAQRKILRDAKFPDEDEPYAMRLYYREAGERIEAYHRNNHDGEWLITKAEELAQLASLTNGSSAGRLRHNSRALRQYKQNFSKRRFILQPPLRLSMNLKGVRISIYPDLNVLEGGKQKLVKFDFSSGSINPEIVKIISQATYEAAKGQVSELSASSILYLDVPRGVEHRGARAGSRILRDIDASCETIAAVWDTISRSR